MARDNKKNDKKRDVSFGFGLGVVFIVAGILSFYFYPNLLSRTFFSVLVFVGFLGVGTEFEKIDMRGPYKLAFGFYFLLFSFWSWEYFDWLFILAISLSFGIFFSALAEYLMTRNENESEKKKEVGGIEGTLSIIGSVCSIVGFVIALLTL